MASQKQASVDAQSFAAAQQSPSHDAAKKGTNEQVARLLAESADVNAQTEDGVVLVQEEHQKHGSFTDPIDGYTYRTVELADQVWMAQNLRTTKYNDGTEIPLVTDNTAWDNLATDGYCWFADDPAVYADPYGALYNWHAVNTGKLCPTGWHVPTDAEWHQLVLFLDPDAAVIHDPKVTLSESLIAGGKLKETGNLHWHSPNTGATNESGFTALPGGFRLAIKGGFWHIGDQGEWWSSTESSSGTAWGRFMYFDDAKIERGYGIKRSGYSVRCIKD